MNESGTSSRGDMSGCDDLWFGLGRVPEQVIVAGSEEIVTCTCSR